MSVTADGENREGKGPTSDGDDVAEDGDEDRDGGKCKYGPYPADYDERE